MPNLAGIHDPAMSADDLTKDLGRMMTAVDLPAFHFAKRTAYAPGIACGNVLTGVENNLRQPAKDEARGLWLMLDGEILNSRELAVRMGRDDLTDDAEIALAM